MRAQEAFDEMIRDGIWPFLKTHGFKRSKTTFHRPEAKNWQVINVQKSTYSDAGEVSFTINLAVALDLLRDQIHNWPEGKRPPESRCHLRQRIGILLRGQDTWWSLTPDSNIAALSDTINTAIAHVGLPWLEARSDEERLLAVARDPAQLSAQRRDHLHWLAQLARTLNKPELVTAIQAEQVLRAEQAA